MTDKHRPPATSSHEVQRFLEKVARTPAQLASGEPGRLIFAMDATASREPSWDTACQIQAEMFKASGDLGGLLVQLCYYRGFNEFSAGQWCASTDALLRQMTAVRCLGGHTQIGRVLAHALAETGRNRVQAIILVGDAVEEDVDALCHQAGQLGILNLPVFVFQEGSNPTVATAFRQIARLSGGAYAPFDAGSAAQLRQLLSAVAVFAAGGRKALENYSKQTGGEVLRLTRQLK
ncbi:MAG: VWA domain-containing protein [Pseudomonadota bacterium]